MTNRAIASYSCSLTDSLRSLVKIRAVLIPTRVFWWKLSSNCHRQTASQSSHTPRASQKVRPTSSVHARMSVLLETSAGDLVVDLLIDEAPKTCLNFIKLCKSKYYNFAPLYNLQNPSFFQAGDPCYPVGDGGSSCWGLTDRTKKYFKPEISKRQHERGSISMACSAEGLCGSQFFVSLAANPGFDKKHAIFGRLAEGFETLDIIASQAVDEGYRPLRDIRIKHTIILEDPFDDPPEFIGEPPESPLPSSQQLSTVRIAFDDSLEETGTIDEIEARKRAREAEASALTLETLGDLPFASIRPPENILFVCKLNPVTSSSDLELIFGRFGKILSCQVVKDSRTGDSLQYAFIEFDIKEEAERAYFKMQGVLIDDRRIHVDFSQSVAKIPKGQDPTRQRNSDRSRRQHNERRYNPPSNDRRGGYDLVLADSSESRDYRSRSHRHESSRRSDHRRSDGRRDHRDDRERRRHSRGSRSPERRVRRS